jgi:hypothetical protein
MSGVIDIIDDGLKSADQNTIGLTEMDNDVYPLLVTQQANVQIQIDIKIESQAMSGDSMIWGHPTRGVWGSYKWSDSASVGFILGHPIYGRLGFSKLGTNAAAWETVEELINV